MQERRNSIANALGLCLTFTNPSTDEISKARPHWLRIPKCEALISQQLNWNHLHKMKKVDDIFPYFGHRYHILMGNTITSTISQNTTKLMGQWYEHSWHWNEHSWHWNEHSWHWNEHSWHWNEHSWHWNEHSWHWNEHSWHWNEQSCPYLCLLLRIYYSLISWNNTLEEFEF